MRAGKEQCLWFGKHVFVFAMSFSVQFLNVCGLCLGVFAVRCSGCVLLCLVFSSDVVTRLVFGDGDDIS